jgi:hypothetical protein
VLCKVVVAKVVQAMDLFSVVDELVVGSEAP